MFKRLVRWLFEWLGYDELYSQLHVEQSASIIRLRNKCYIYEIELFDIKTAQEVEETLRKNSVPLQNAWNQYNMMLQLTKED